MVEAGGMMDAGYWNESQAAARARGLTQDALAGMLHVTRQTVSSWEIGRTEPDLDTLPRLRRRCTAMRPSLSMV